MTGDTVPMVVVPTACHGCTDTFGAQVPAALVAAGVELGVLFCPACTEHRARG